MAAKEVWALRVQRKFHAAILSGDKETMRTIMVEAITRALRSALTSKQLATLERTDREAVHARLSAAFESGSRRDPKVPASLSNGMNAVNAEARAIVAGVDVPSEFTPDQLLLMGELVNKEVHNIEKLRQEIINKGAREGKTISTEKVLAHAEESKASYSGPDREEYVRSLDTMLAELREKYGPEIPVDEAYRLVKELEGSGRG